METTSALFVCVCVWKIWGNCICTVADDKFQCQKNHGTLLILHCADANDAGAGNNEPCTDHYKYVWCTYLALGFGVGVPCKQTCVRVNGVRVAISGIFVRANSGRTGVEWGGLCYMDAHHIV